MVSFPIKGIVHQKEKNLVRRAGVLNLSSSPSCQRQELRNAQSETGQLKEVHDSHGKTYGNCHEKNNRLLLFKYVHDANELCNSVLRCTQSLGGVLAWNQDFNDFNDFNAIHPYATTG